MRLSLCINTFNEEKNIRIPLDSAYDLVDEVIIIDGSSKDKTVEVAKSYGKKVKVFVVDNPRNFLANKQRAIEAASGEWILQLDADEALSDDLKKEIKDILLSPKSGTLGYNIPRKNWFLTRFLMKGGVYPDYVLRLYKKENARFDLKNVHENVRIIDKSRVKSQESKVQVKNEKSKDVKIENGKLKIGYLKYPIFHYADPNFSRYLIRWDRYTTFDAEELVKKYPDSSSAMRNWAIFINYFCIKPKWWFLKTYFRHKGFMDGFPGFVFSFFSALRFPVIYIKWWQLKHHHGISSAPAAFEGKG